MEDYYVGWGVLSLLNAGSAQGKNRSGFNWWLVSIFLGPIATFLVVIFEKLPEKKRSAGKKKKR